ncbi:hypothetical protein QJQ45_023694, partial [Haematococcus lacustris]
MGMGLDRGAIQAVSAASGVWDEDGCLERFFTSKLTVPGASWRSKQLVVFFSSAGIGTQGGWGGKAVLQACRKMVERPNSGRPTDRVKGTVVTVEEFRTSRVSSAVNSPQPCEEELDAASPRPEGSQRFEAPVRGLMWCPKLDQATPGDNGKWVDRDCYAAFNLQRIGEAKWRPLELCWWKHRARAPAQGKENPAMGFKQLRDQAPKAQAQQPVTVMCASGSGQQEVVGERRQVIKAAIRGLVEAARPDLSPAQVDAVVAEVNKRMTMGNKQCCLTAVLCLSMLLQCFLGQPTEGFPAAGPAPGLATRSSPRSAAAPAQLPPPVQHNIWDPKLLAQIKDAMELLTTARVLEHLMRGPHHSGIKLLPAEVAVFEQPSSAWPLAMLKHLDEVHLTGDGNSLNANATTISTSIMEVYRHPGRFIKWWGKAIGVVKGGFSRVAQKHFPQLVLGRLDYSLPDREHKWRLPANSVLRQPRWVAEVATHCRLLGLEARWREGVDSIGEGGPGVRSQAVKEPVELPFIG